MGWCYLCKYIRTVLKVVSFSEDSRTSGVAPRDRLDVRPAIPTNDQGSNRVIGYGSIEAGVCGEFEASCVMNGRIGKGEGLAMGGLYENMSYSSA